MQPYKSTGIFFHYQQGQRLKDFPSALEGILDKDNIMYCDAFYDFPPDSIYDIPPVPLSELYQLHSSSMVEQVKKPVHMRELFTLFQELFWLLKKYV
ncbi:MAG: hypothetical protein SWO11_04705 [Thermodesulfobacteriota bacterium]|nr:hypothetical protein [Thermodesulfobacteriota bacterium]